MSKFLRLPILAYGALAARCKRLAAVWCVALWAAVGIAHAEPVTILALGDSLTQGYGLPVEDGLVPQMQKWLAANGHDAVVLNAGVSGDTTAGGLSRVEWSLTDRVDAMIVALGGNDLLRGIDPANSRANLRGILEVAKAHNLPVLLIGLPAPGNYGPDYKRDFEAMYVDLAAEFDTLLVRDMLGPITGADGAASGRMQTDLLQPDRIHPNAEGVKRIVEALGPEVVKLIARMPQR
ncbi:MAG: arylesterase [Rhodobacteraceae bacterium]|nr:arylesterase [Paracoccaceae bacterium]